MHLPDEQCENRDETLRAPAKLVSALKKLPQEEFFVPRTVDESILKAARKQLRPASKNRRNWWRLVPWAVGATTAVVVGLIMLQPQWVPPNVQAEARLQDLNHDGVIDVLDAFALARELEAGRTRPEARDLNGDGRTDQVDLGFLLAEVVRLDKGGRL